MSRDTETQLTPQQAVQTLHDLEHYEEALTRRSAGLTMMVWGIAIPGLTMSYAAMGDWALVQRMEWILSLVWVPWILGGMLATRGIWDVNAVSLRLPKSHGLGWLWGVGIMVLFYGLAGIFFLVDHLLKLDMNVPTIMALAGGILTIAIGILVRVVSKGNGGPMSFAGVMLTLFNVGMAAAQPTDMEASALSALAVFVAYLATGLYYYRRG